MEIDAPTFNSLNKPQRRALILRDELRYVDARYLDNFIEGLANPEPPTYERINGVVYPPLTMVTLKDTATRFDLGNVHFDNDVSLGTGVFRAYLTVEDGRFELRTDDPLPLDDANISSVAIHVFIAKSMVPLFETKFKTIWARKNQINEIRQVAFNMCSQQPAEEFQEGETLARFDTGRQAGNGAPGQGKKQKRLPGAPVVKHASNKRKRVGLDTIPESAKAETFNTIPDAIKVNLFNNVVKTAFPNFDNLMMASWNVVSVYSNVGTDFPELHKAIVELKSVLQDFEEGLGGKPARGDLKVRRDFAPPEQDGAGGENGTSGSSHPGPDSNQNGGGDAPLAPRGDAATTSQQHDDLDSLFVEAEDEHDAGQVEPATSAPEDEQDQDQKQEMPPPRSIPVIKRPAFNDDETDDSDHPRTNKTDRRSSSVFTRSTPEKQRSREPSASIDAHTSRAPSQSRGASDLKRSLSTQSLAVNVPPTSKRPKSLGKRASMAGYAQHTAPDSHDNSDKDNDEDDDDSDEAIVRRKPTLSHPPSPFPTSTSISTPRPNTPSSPAPNKKRSLADSSPTALRQAYNERKKKLIDTFGGSANVPQQYRVQMQRMLAEIKTKEKEEEKEKEKEQEKEVEIMAKQWYETRMREGKGHYDLEAGMRQMEKDRGGDGDIGGTGRGTSMPKYLGNSVLGGKKSAGTSTSTGAKGNGNGVPVASMVPGSVKRDDAEAGKKGMGMY
ncbi:hypothetical protein FB567DRAFT_355804 [Paraphoma chrysanthemicola]|uniref:Uncharacterized protein n=1 Tax=Paraphoma chrysanthemicola TaxID=798071 RepID=A0A8K0R661_9PLEO|nr:hypothetical protein FB567DRAFT_355804 [Paraphoma chrysanthemicola]